MNKLTIFLFVAALSLANLCLAGDSCCPSASDKCYPTSSACCPSGHTCASYNACCDKCDLYKHPDWGYSYNDPHYLSSCAPCELKCFWEIMIPMLEARKSAESAYLRENSDRLLYCAKKVPGSLEWGTYHQRKHYNRAAKELVRGCENLRELSWGASSSSLYSEMKQVEASFVRLNNLCE